MADNRVVPPADEDRGYFLGRWGIKGESRHGIPSMKGALPSRMAHILCARFSFGAGALLRQADLTCQDRRRTHNNAGPHLQYHPLSQACFSRASARAHPLRSSQSGNTKIAGSLHPSISSLHPHQASKQDAYSARPSMPSRPSVKDVSRFGAFCATSEALSSPCSA